MNTVFLVGKLIKDPEMRSAGPNHTAVARFSIAIKRNYGLGTDYPNVVCFGSNAEFAKKNLARGMFVAVAGRIQTGSYEKHGDRVYTLDVIADRIECIKR